MEILLYQLETLTSKSAIKLKKIKGIYLIDGYDSGKTVRDVFGGFGYEYSIKFNENEIRKLDGFLDSNNDSFMKKWIAKYIDDPKCFSKIKTQLDFKGIKYEYFTWRDAD